MDFEKRRGGAKREERPTGGDEVSRGADGGGSDAVADAPDRARAYAARETPMHGGCEENQLPFRKWSLPKLELNVLL